MSTDCLIVTSTSLRHKYFAIQVLRHVPNSLVVFEERDRIKYYKVELQGLMKVHFSKLFETESRYFNQFVDSEKILLESKTIGVIGKNEINSQNFINKLLGINPKCICLYSVSIVKDKLISLYRHRLFNVHAGLSPFYRGTATNIWPIINKELEYIGMTIHHIDLGIDSGGIILQGRPILSPDDDTHTMACKNTKLAAHLMIKTIKRFLGTGSVPSYQQDLSKGRQYYFNEFNHDVVKKLNKLLEEGIVSDYLENARDVDIVLW